MQARLATTSVYLFKINHCLQRVIARLSLWGHFARYARTWLMAAMWSGFSLAAMAQVVISPANPPGIANPVLGSAYSQTFTISGGIPPYNVSPTGAPPTGMTATVSGASVVLSGTPVASGTFNLTITATDSSSTPITKSESYNYTVGAPAITVAPASLPAPVFGTAYNQTVTASGGIPGYSYVISSGALPPGLSLNTSTGQISGTPTSSGTFNFTLSATDSTGGTGPFTGSQAYTLTVTLPVFTLNPTSLPGATVGAAYSQTLTASGAAAPFSYAITAGALPAGISLSTAGTLSGTPISAGTNNFTITATDSSPAPGTQTTSRAYTVVTAPPNTIVSPISLPNGTIGSAYNQSISASGGIAPYSFSFSAGAPPAGISLSSSGALTGTPTTGGAYSFTITAIGSSTGVGAPHTGSRAYTVNIVSPVLALTPASGALPMSYGAASTISFNTTGGTGPYTYSLQSGSLPTGVSFSSAGVLSGTPTMPGNYSFAVRSTDAFAVNVTQNYTVVVATPTINITPASLPDGTAGTAYNQTLTASGGVAPYTFSLTAGALPVGTSFNSAGLLSGTPSTSGSFSMTVKATDAHGQISTATYNLTIAAAPNVQITPPTLPAGTVDSPYNQSLTSTGGTAPYTYAVIAGALPPGLTLSPAGTLSGTSSAAGSYTWTIQSTDSANHSGTQSYTVEIKKIVVEVPVSDPAQIPVLTHWGLALLAAALALAGWRLRRRG